ncbi:SDR family NAD(P)-dependent oxidoreductase [Oryzobacter telluris]|uniref:SDR family NAD(P)-dependent oxidoreductase n=1 Tax=Oryzobacter telluris TaxID=3149179 RepID=UPI00370D2A90
MRLSGAHVLLTGATGTIGSRLATELAARGARLTLVARTAPDLTALAAPLGAHALPADLTDTDRLPDLLAAAEDHHGPVDVLVHNAAAESAALLTDVRDGEVARTVALNLVAPLELTRLVLPSMLRRGHGHVVAVSSLAAVATFPGLTLYGATKAGLSAAMAGLRLELRGTGIGTTTVELGPVASPMMERIATEPTSAAAFGRARSLGVLPLLDPDDVATAVAEAVDADRRHLTLPRRAAPLAAMSQAPRSVVRLALTGLRPAHHEAARA